MNNRRLSCAVLVAAALAAVSPVRTVSAQWTQFSLPQLSDWYAPTAIGHLPDGRYVFGMQGSYYLQNVFGAASFTQYTNTSPGDLADPSFIAVYDATTALAGGGGWGASDLYRFNPSSVTSPSFVAQGLSLQNYWGVWRDSRSVYVGGGNGSGGSHAIAYVDLDSGTTKIIVDNISTWSCGFARDAAGNLYVGDNDDRKVYKFSLAQINAAIAGSALSISDGEYLYTSSTSLGTMAVDGLGRIWAAGWNVNGLELYDPASGSKTMLVPALTNANYAVTTFSVGSDHYVAYVNKAGWSPGSAQLYGYMLIPEPGTAGLTLVGVGLLIATRRRFSCG